MEWEEGWEKESARQQGELQDPEPEKERERDCDKPGDMAVIVSLKFINQYIKKSYDKNNCHSMQ